MDRWINSVVASGASLRDAVKTMDAGGCQLVMVVGPDRRLLGILTDGDLRRAMLASTDLDSPVDQVMQRHPKSLAASASRSLALSRMRELDVAHLPVIDSQHRLIGLEMLRDTDAISEGDHWAVIMAGGFGKRLAPLTDKLPKPLIRVGDRPIIEHIIESLARHGVRRIFVSVNYRAEQIVDFCGNGDKWGVELSYLEEDTPRGTAGALSLLPSRPPGKLLVMNGDILSNLDYGALLDFHEQQGSPATMCVREQKIQIQYGVVQFEGPYISDIVEKPFHSCFINAGIYALDGRALDLVPDDGYFDMPTLFKELVRNGQRAGVFPLREYWLDIGTPADLARAQQEVGRVIPLTRPFQSPARPEVQHPSMDASLLKAVARGSSADDRPVRIGASAGGVK